MIGSTGAMKPDTPDTTVVFMYWWQMLRQAASTLCSARSTPARSSSSPWMSAMLSPFSRSRVST